MSKSSPARSEPDLRLAKRKCSMFHRFPPNFVPAQRIWAKGEAEAVLLVPVADYLGSMMIYERARGGTKRSRRRMPKEEALGFRPLSRTRSPFGAKIDNSTNVGHDMVISWLTGYETSNEDDRKNERAESPRRRWWILAFVVERLRGRGALADGERRAWPRRASHLCQRAEEQAKLQWQNDFTRLPSWS